MGSRRRSGWQRSYKRALATSRLYQAFAFEIAVCLQDGVGIDRCCRDDLAHTWKLVTQFEHSHTKCLAYLLDDLHIGRHARTPIHSEPDHDRSMSMRCLSTLRHCDGGVKISI